MPFVAVLISAIIVAVNTYLVFDVNNIKGGVQAAIVGWMLVFLITSPKRKD